MCDACQPAWLIVKPFSLKAVKKTCKSKSLSVANSKITGYLKTSFTDDIYLMIRILQKITRIK